MTTDSSRATAASAPPVVVSCHGGTAAAQLAEEVVALLAGRGDAELGDPGALARGEYAGRTIAAVDGCSSACGARLLAAKGIQPDVTLNVEALAGGCAVATVPATATPAASIASSVAGRIARGSSRPLRRRKPRRPVPLGLGGDGAAVAEGVARGHTVEDYLRAIDTLTSPVAECGALATDAPTLASYVSMALGVTRVSAGAMLVRLERLGLVERNSSKEVLLTSAGRAEADEAVLRLRLLECFVASFLGYPLADCRGQARTLANSFDHDAIERVRNALGDPERCPHGWPLDAARARAESEHLLALHALAPGREAVIARLSEDDVGLLGRLAPIGAVPGALVVADGGTAGRVRIRIGDDPTVHELDAAAATGVIVEPRAVAGSLAGSAR